MPHYDISQPVADGMPVYPGDPPVDIEPLSTIDDDGYRQTALNIDSHTGTHLDAPAHMIADGRTIDEFPIETFRFSALRVDCTGLGPRAEITVATITAGLADRSIADVDLLVVQTGWDHHWGSNQYFDHPFLTNEAAEWLVDRGLHLAVDTPNVDPTPTDRAAPDEPGGYPVHHTLLSSGQLLLENLRGLDRLPKRFRLCAYPLSVRKGDGAPVRAVAVVDE